MKKSFFTILIVLTSLLGDEKYLSNTQKEILKIKKDIIQKEYEQNRYDWISPLYLKANISTANESEESKKVYFSFDQDLYKSGGIRYGIKYAKILEQLNTLGVDIEQKGLLKELFLNVLDLHINDLNIKQTKIEIERIKIDIDIKKSKESLGYGSPTDLSDSIRTKNSLMSKLYQLENEKLNLVSAINKLSDVDYLKIPLPEISLISKKELIKNSSELKYASYNNELKKYNLEIIKTNFMPKISLSSQYGIEERAKNSGDFYNVGLTLSMPFDITSKDTNEKARLEYLKSKLEIENKTKEIILSYQKALNNINRYNNDKEEAKKDIKIYTEDLSIHQTQLKAGVITPEVISIKENDKKIREIDIDINELKIKREILTLYYMI